jgi:hypothetical protein
VEGLDLAEVDLEQVEADVQRLADMVLRGTHFQAVPRLETPVVLEVVVEVAPEAG